METQELASIIVKKLIANGYVAYYAGGWVRDFVLGHTSSDIDIATSALPEEILALFPKTRLIGISFGIVVVIEEGHPFEVATFRKDLEYRDGRHPSHVVYTGAEEDAKRRDFTINGMFYDPIEKEIIDYVGGREDIQKGVIRAIGDPFERFGEDRLRMIRAVRFAACFGFHIDPATKKAIQQYASALFPSVAKERVWQELSKITQNPNPERALISLHRLGLLGEIFPELKEVPLDVIKQRVQEFCHYPKGCPAIFYLMALFPESSLDQLIEVFLRLKVSQREIKHLRFAHLAKHLLRSGCGDLVDWVYFYAHPFADKIIAICAFPYTQKHQERRERLLPHITRLVQRRPLVTSQHLRDKGICPGKEMGLLLKEAERIAILQNFEDPEEVLKCLGL